MVICSGIIFCHLRSFKSLIRKCIYQLLTNTSLIASSPDTTYKCYSGSHIQLLPVLAVTYGYQLEPVQCIINEPQPMLDNDTPVFPALGGKLANSSCPQTAS